METTPKTAARRYGPAQTMLLCGLLAAVMFLPFVIVDKGFFHYAGDFNSQQISFYRMMNGFVKSGGSYSWLTDLGSGAMNAYSFYLYGSPFFWLSLAFPGEWLPYLMVPLLILKFALAGGGAYLFLRRRARPDLARLGAVLYSLSGWGVYNIFFNHFIDVLALFPWLLWAMEECIYHRRRGLFAFFVALNLMNSYFFFAGQAVFLILYYFCLLSAGWLAEATRREGVLRVTGRVLFEGLLGGAMGCVLLIPAAFSLIQNPRVDAFASGWGMLTYSCVQQYLAILLSWVMPPDSPYIPSIWSEGIIKWSSMTAYLPLCSLAGVLTYRAGKRRDGFCRVITLCAVCALVPILNSAFYAFNVSYYARWYYMPVLILCAMSVGAWEEADVARLCRPVRPLVGIMLATLVFAIVPVKTEGGWHLGVLEEPAEYAAMLGIGLVGLLIYRLICRYRADRVRFVRRLTAAVSIFACLFGMVHIGIGKFGQWYEDADLVEQYRAAARLSGQMPEGDYRIDLYGTHDNLGLWIEKSCIRFFGSTVSPSLLRFYPSVNVTRDVRSDPDLANYALRGLLGVRYLIIPEDRRADFEAECDPGWDYEQTLEGFALYRNRNEIPLGFACGEYLTEEIYNRLPKATRANLLARAVVLAADDIEGCLPYAEAMSPGDWEELTYADYAADCAARRAEACTEFRMEKDGFSAEITLSRPRLVVFAVPWDEGFSAAVGGRPAEVLQVDEGLMAVRCPAGRSVIRFVYRPRGLDLSTRLAVGGWVVFGLYLMLCALLCRRVESRVPELEIELKPEEEAEPPREEVPEAEEPVISIELPEPEPEQEPKEPPEPDGVVP